jgi:predicted Zn-ribbon and HTH transcriptional regulator
MHNNFSITKCEKCGEYFRSNYYKPAKNCPNCRPRNKTKLKDDINE